MQHMFLCITHVCVFFFFCIIIFLFFFPEITLSRQFYDETVHRYVCSCFGYCPFTPGSRVVFSALNTVFQGSAFFLSCAVQQVVSAANRSFYFNSLLVEFDLKANIISIFVRPP